MLTGAAGLGVMSLLLLKVVELLLAVVVLLLLFSTEAGSPSEAQYLSMSTTGTTGTTGTRRCGG